MSAREFAAAVSDKRRHWVYASGVYRSLLELTTEEMVVFVASLEGYTIAPQPVCQHHPRRRSPSRYTMVASNYTNPRRLLAKAIGLGAKGRRKK